MNQQAETVVVADMDQFIQLLFGWHEGKVKVLEHLLTIPQGTEISFNDEGTKILEGDLHKGFTIGLSLALMELGTLPFAAEVEEIKPASPDEPIH